MNNQSAIFRAKSNQGCSENFKDPVCSNAIKLFPVIDFNFHNLESFLSFRLQQEQQTLSTLIVLYGLYHFTHCPHDCSKKVRICKKKIELWPKELICFRDQRNKQLNCIYPKIIFLDNLTAVAYQKSLILFGFPCFPLKLFYHGHGILNYLLILKKSIFWGPQI